MPQVTIWEEMLRASTRSGWMGLLFVLLFAVFYLQGIWHVVRRRTDRVFQDAVIGVFLIALFYLQGIYYGYWSLQTAQAACAQSALLWWNSYLRLKLSLILICSLGPLLLIGFAVRRNDKAIKSPGCVPGAITALLGALVLDLFILSGVFYNACLRDVAEFDRLHQLLRKERRERNADRDREPHR